MFKYVGNKDKSKFWYVVMKKVNGILLVTLFLSAGFISIFSEPVYSDGGYIPYEPLVDFTVYEPGQKAIIAWDGTEEILILSVDVQGSKETKVLHMVPIPSLPSVSLGNISSFEKVNQILYYHLPHDGTDNYGGEGEAEGENQFGNGVKIEFEKTIGPHNVTAVRVENIDGFINWVGNYLSAQGINNVSYIEGTNEVISHYLSQNINYFVFDEINIIKNTTSVEPLIYRFNSSYLYYPLTISSIIDGYSEIEVVTIVPDDVPVDRSQIRKIRFDEEYRFRILHNEIEEIAPEFNDIITGNAYLHYYKGMFQLSDLYLDIKLSKIRNVQWMKSIDSSITRSIYMDCNNDGIKDLILYTSDFIQAIDNFDGSILWNRKIEENYGYNQYLSLLNFELIDIIGDETNELILVTRHDFLYGNDQFHSYNITTINPINGKIIWNYWTLSSKYKLYFDQSVQISDLDSDNKFELILPIDSTHIKVINAEDGSELWYYSTMKSEVGEILDFLIIDVDNDLELDLLLSTTKYILALNGNDGTNKWTKIINSNYENLVLRKNLERAIFDSDSDNKLELLIDPYGSKSSGTLLLLNCEDGTSKWRHQFSNSRGVNVRSQYPGWSIDDSYLICDIESDDDFEIICFRKDGIFVVDANNGKLLWKITDGNFSHWYNREFEVFDIDIDDTLELIYSIDNQLFVVDAETGELCWKRVFQSQSYPVYFKNYIKDFDNDSKPEIICWNDYKIYSLNGFNGSIKWARDFNYFLVVQTEQPMDLDVDNDLELLIYTNYNYYLINCNDGSIIWNVDVQDFSYLDFNGFDDIDQDDNLEIIFDTNFGLHMLNSATGNTLWDFSNGELIYPSNFGYGTPHKNNIIIIDNLKIYSIKLPKLAVFLSAGSISTVPGENLTFIVKASYYDNGLTGVNIKPSDNGFGGKFYPVIELYPGIYEFTYQVPETNELELKITIDATHPNYFGETATYKLNLAHDIIILEQDFISIPKHEIFTLSTIPIPENLKPGESTTVLFRFITNHPVSLSSYNISLADNNVNGTFSKISWYSKDYMKFTYTVPENIKTDTIRILIFVSHEKYRGGIGVVKLNVIINDTGDQQYSDVEPIIIPKDIGYTNLSYNITAYPSQISAGEETTVVLYLINGTYIIDNADVQVFNNGLNGVISKINNHLDGHYSFSYKMPIIVPSSVQYAPIILYITLPTSVVYEIEYEIGILHKEPMDEIEIDPEKFSIKITPRPPVINSDDTCIIFVHIDDLSKSLLMDEVSLTITDNGKPGKISYIDKYAEGKYIFEYWVPEDYVGEVTFTVKAYYYYQVIKSRDSTINVHAKNIEDEKKIEQTNSNSNEALILNLYFIIIFLIFIIGILIGIFSIVIYQRKVKRKSTQTLEPKKLDISSNNYLQLNNNKPLIGMNNTQKRIKTIKK
jgi:hypothetical protein